MLPSTIKKEIAKALVIRLIRHSRVRTARNARWKTSGKQQTQQYDLHISHNAIAWPQFNVGAQCVWAEIISSAAHDIIQVRDRIRNKVSSGQVGYQEQGLGIRTKAQEKDETKRNKRKARYGNEGNESGYRKNRKIENEEEISMEEKNKLERGRGKMKVN